MSGLSTLLFIVVPIVFAVMILVVSAIFLIVVLPPARKRLREDRMRQEIERRTATGDEPAD